MHGGFGPEAQRVKFRAHVTPGDAACGTCVPFRGRGFDRCLGVLVQGTGAWVQ